LGYDHRAVYIIYPERLNQHILHQIDKSLSILTYVGFDDHHPISLLLA
jgi:hypothetical protein